MTAQALETWHHLVCTQVSSALDGLMADDVVFYSPVAHTPQRGKKLMAMLQSAQSLA